jgi:myosin heavy subunit
MRDTTEISKEKSERQMTFGSLVPERMASERDAIYEGLAKLAEGQPATEAPPKEEPKPDAPPAEVATETKAEISAEEPKLEPEKTVPYNALKEEREKRKALKSEVDTLKEQMKQLLDANKQYADMLQERKEPETPISDYDAELLNSRKEIKSLKSEIANMRSEFVNYQKLREQDQVQRTQQDTERKAKEVDKELADTGYKGFYKHIPQIVFAMDQEGVSPDDRTPETWKRIYKEIVYPDVFGDYVPKTDKTAQKEALKAEAAKVIKTSGRPDMEPKEEGEWTFEKALAFQRSQRIS